MPRAGGSSCPARALACAHYPTEGPEQTDPEGFSGLPPDSALTLVSQRPRPGRNRGGEQWLCRVGHRFPVSMADVFPHGVYAMSVEQAQDYDEKSGRRSPSKDKHTGELVWTVTVIDRDPEAREEQGKVKVTAPVQPVLSGEIMPGSGLHAVEFTDLTITPYVNEGRAGGRPRMAYSLRATDMHAQGKDPTGSTSAAAGGPGRPGGQASTGAS